MIFNEKSGRRIAIALVACFAWMSVITLGFDKFAYEVDAFNARTRLALTTGDADVRNFNALGLPVSYSARTRQPYVSPFYVVHYGLVYSDPLAERFTERPAWQPDPSRMVWNIPPPVSRQEYFKNCADWVVSNLARDHGQAHLLYQFDWPYHAYPNGGLTAPWWSGLTDGYAIILLLRAHDVYGDSKYLDAATKLYHSAIAGIPNGGSRNTFHGKPWIEEYVDPRADPGKLSFVLNGMIYATHGIEAYEKYMSISDPVAPALYDSIASNLGYFDRGKWSDYDAIGNSANLKYERVHVALLAGLPVLGNSAAVTAIRDRWQRGLLNPGWYWLTNSSLGISQEQFIFEYLAALLLPLSGYFAIRRKANHRKVSEGI